MRLESTQPIREPLVGSPRPSRNLLAPLLELGDLSEGTSFFVAWPGTHHGSAAGGNRENDKTAREVPALTRRHEKAPETRRAHLPVSLCETDVRRAAPGVKATRACTAAADSREGATRDFRSLTAAPPNSLDFAGRLDLARSFAARVTAGELPYTLVLHAGLSKVAGKPDNPQAANERRRGRHPDLPEYGA